jgi:hypothetical protein
MYILESDTYIGTISIVILYTVRLRNRISSGRDIPTYSTTVPHHVNLLQTVL